MSLVTLVVMEYAQLYCICGVTGIRKITRSNYSEVTSCQGTCLELVAGLMMANLGSNDRNALGGFPLTSETKCWLDSTVAFHWIHDNSDYR